MAPTTFRAFVDNLEAVTVTGVQRQYEQGPPMGAPGVGDLPCSFVRTPYVSEGPLVFDEQGGMTNYHAVFVYCVEPVGQSTTPANFDEWVDAVDSVLTAMRGVTCGSLGLAHHTWAVQPNPHIEIAGIRYWAVQVDVEGWL